MKFISYLLSPIFMLTFFLLLVVFQPLQWLSLNLFGFKGHKIVVDVLNWFLVKSMLILWVPVRFENKHSLSKENNYIFVANHQSLFDIPPLILYLRKLFVPHLPKLPINLKRILMTSCLPTEFQVVLLKLFLLFSLINLYQVYFMTLIN